MVGIEIDPERCHGCWPCIARQACRVRAIVQIEPGEVVYVDPARCHGCVICIPACPYAAIQPTNPQIRTTEASKPGVKKA